MKNLKLKAKIVEKFGTQESFAQAAGLTPSGVSRVITGQRRLTDTERRQWAKLLKTRISEVFYA